MEKLFIYGTLAPGRPNEHILKEVPGTWEEASVKGYLHQEGWGAAMGYPGIIIDEDGQEVKGFLFSSQELSSQWEMLDSFEGQEYERILVPVILSNKTTTHAYIYSLKH